MKKKLSATIILVIIGVLIILLFFAIKQNEIKKEIKKNKLVCEKTTKDIYNVKYKIYYKEGKTKTIEMTYEDRKQNRSEENYSETSNELKYYASLPETKYTYVNSNIIITLDKKVLENHKKDKKISNLYKEYSKEKEYLENKEFDCN